jgi:predicted dehydrogenase
MKQIKLGIIGFGEMGKRHGREFMETSQGTAKVQAVVETSDNKYKEGCEWCNCSPTRYTDPAAMLAAESLDGIIISTPNSTHYDMLQACAGRRTPILLEKPMEVSLERVCDIVRFARSYRGPIMVHHVMRYSPIVKKAGQLIAAGRLGRICAAHFAHYEGGGMWHSFRRTKAGGGGMLIEKATHDLDVMLNLIGAKPVRLAALSRQQAYGGDKPDDLHCRDCDERLECPESFFRSRVNPGKLDVDISVDLCVYAKSVDVADNETCLIEFERGIIGSFTHCYFVHRDFTREYQIIGLNALMRISFTAWDRGYKGRLTLAPRFQRDGDQETHEFEYYGKIHYNGGPYVVYHFLDIISGRAKPETTVEQAWAAEMIGFTAPLAAEQGRFIEVADELPKDLKPIWPGIKLDGGGPDVAASKRAARSKRAS